MIGSAYLESNWGSRAIDPSESTGRAVIWGSRRQATIRSDDSGYTIYANGMGNHPEYIHNSRVDGSNTYGGCWYCFPMRSMIGVAYSLGTVSGSRSISSASNTAYTNLTVSQGAQATIASGVGGYTIGGNNNTGWTTVYTHNTAIDGNVTYGKVWGFPRRPIVGCGYSGADTICGSRAIDPGNSTARAMYWASCTKGNDWQ